MKRLWFIKLSLLYTKLYTTKPNNIPSPPPLSSPPTPPSSLAYFMPAYIEPMLDISLLLRATNYCLCNIIIIRRKTVPVL